MAKTLAILVTAVLLTGCGGSGSSGPSVTLTGSYQGTETFTSGASGSTSFQLTIVQNGSAVTGSYSNGRGDRGTFSCTLSGTHCGGTASSAQTGITCTFSGDATNGGATLTGTVVCSSGIGAEITVNRV